MFLIKISKESNPSIGEIVDHYGIIGTDISIDVGIFSFANDIVIPWIGHLFSKQNSILDYNLNYNSFFSNLLSFAIVFAIVIFILKYVLGPLVNKEIKERNLEKANKNK